MGYERPNRQRQQSSNEDSERQRATTQTTLEGQIVQSHYATVTLNTRSVRPAVNAQPMFDQNLTQSGEQARRAYQATALAGDVELANRLDVVV